MSTWTPDILVVLKDLLLALSEDQMHQIPTKSWTDMADLIVTSYAEDTLDEYGVARPFYKVNMKDTWKYLLGLGTGGYPIQGFNILCTVECR